MTVFAKVLFGLGLVSALAAPAAYAQDAATPASSDRLLIVNGNTEEVIYDDGRDDLFCVTRVHVVGYNQYGHRIYRRTMRCR